MGGFFIRVLAVWVVIMAVESIHGVLRTLFLEPLVGDFRARQISVFTASGLIVVITFACIRWVKGSRMADFIFIGFMWVALTVAFEIALGRFTLGLSWERIASDYNLAEGGLMPLGLLVMFTAPSVAAKFYGEI